MNARPPHKNVKREYDWRLTQLGIERYSITIMVDPFKGWISNESILDKILYRDPPRLLRQLEVKDGITRVAEWITFADGSRLAISAQVPLPPLNDMLPSQVFVLKPNGERGMKWDDGSNEAMSLARGSIAMRFLEAVSKMLDEMPECGKVICPACNGEKFCPCCHGAGCPDCQGTGLCRTCSGHGKVAQD